MVVDPGLWQGVRLRIVMQSQPLQANISASYRPVHHLGLCCAHPMLQCSSLFAYTPNWPIARLLLLLHPPGTLPADIRLCENILTFKRHFKNPYVQTHLVLLCCLKRLCSDLKTLCKSIIIIIIIIMSNTVPPYCPPF